MFASHGLVPAGCARAHLNKPAVLNKPVISKKIAAFDGISRTLPHVFAYKSRNCENSIIFFLLGLFHRAPNLFHIGYSRIIDLWCDLLALFHASGTGRIFSFPLFDLLKRCQFENPRFARKFSLGFIHFGFIHFREIGPAGCALGREHRFQLQLPLPNLIFLVRSLSNTGGVGVRILS